VPKPSQTRVSVSLSTAADSIVLGIPGVRSCLVVSADGLPLAIHPASEGAEAELTKVWSRLASLGPLRRGFVTMGSSEVWAFVQTERHGVLLLADAEARGGPLLEAVDQILVAAEAEQPVGSERAVRLERRPGGEAGGARESRERGASGRRFRMPLHRDPRARPERPAAGSAPAGEPVLGVELRPAVGPKVRRTGEGSGDVDVGSLAREFSALLSDREEWQR
jgi:hypothetical protein